VVIAHGSFISFAGKIFFYYADELDIWFVKANLRICDGGWRLKRYPVLGIVEVNNGKTDNRNWRASL
jgi:hypothetical protein